MTDNRSDSPGRVVGIGGIFFKSAAHEELRAWYQNHLGIQQGPDGALFKWRSHDNPDTVHITAWSIFPQASSYFDPSGSSFMVNYIVDDLDALLVKLAAAGVQIDPKREDHDYGRFAWIYDPDGNKIELWQPPLSS